MLSDNSPRYAVLHIPEGAIYGYEEDAQGMHLPHKVPYFLPASMEHMGSLVAGRRKAIEVKIGAD